MVDARADGIGARGPQRDEERAIVKATTSEVTQDIHAVLTAADILTVQKMVRKVPVSDHIVDYAVRLVRATRPKEEGTPELRS